MDSRRFYIDYENVKDNGLEGISNLIASDTVEIFYSEDAQRISFATHLMIANSSASFDYKMISSDVKTVANALDVLILLEVEADMKENKASEYYIVSKDGDFKEFINRKKKKKYAIELITDVAKVSKKANKKAEVIKAKPKDDKVEAPKTKPTEQVIRSIIGRYLKDFKNRKEDIVGAWNASSTKAELNNKLQKSFSNEDVKTILEALKNQTKKLG